MKRRSNGRDKGNDNKGELTLDPVVGKEKSCNPMRKDTDACNRPKEEHSAATRELKEATIIPVRM